MSLKTARVAGLLGVMIDDQVDAVDQRRRSSAAARRPSRCGRSLRRCSGVIISTWMSSRFTIRWFSGRVTPCERADDRRLLGAAQHVAQRQAAGHRVGIGVVVQEDQDAVGVAEEALVLLDLEAGQRAAELGEQRAAEELRQREVVDLGKLRLEFFFALARVRGADAEHVDQRAAGVADGFENLLRMLFRPLSSTMTQVPGVRSALR